MYFPLLETLLKIPCHLVALVKISLFVRFHFSLGLFYCVYPLLTRDKNVCIITHLNSSLFGIKIEQQSFLETRKTVCRIHIVRCNVSSNVGTHTTNLTSNALSLISLWVQTKISILYQPWTLLKMLPWTTISYLLVVFVKVLLQYC